MPRDPRFPRDPRRAIAEQLAYEARLADLRRHAQAFDGLDVVVLKGPLLALRLYEVPAERPSTDVDLLVPSHQWHRAVQALEAQGFVPADGPYQRFYLERHHHVHFAHDFRPTVELHHTAYRGFGAVLPGDPPCARSMPAPSGYAPLRVLEPHDEWLYLAVHAAAHRFERPAWIYDLFRLEQTHDIDHRRVEQLAAQTGFRRVVRYVRAMMFESYPGVARGPSLGRVATGCLGALRSASFGSGSARPARFAFALALADGPRPSLRLCAERAMNRLYFGGPP